MLGAPSAGATTPPTAAGGQPIATAKTTATPGGAKAGKAAGQAGGPAGGSGDAVPATPTPVPPGTYRYHQQGSAGPSGSAPPEGTLVVDAAHTDGTQVWHRDVQPGQPGTDTTVLFRPDGMYYSMLVFYFNGTAVTCTFTPPGVPAPPWPPTVGRSVSSQGKCTFNTSTFTVTVNGKITGTQPTKLPDGTNLNTFVASTVINISGTYLATQINGTVNETDWFSPSLRMLVHSDSTTTINGQSSRLISDLESAKPA